MLTFRSARSRTAASGQGRGPPVVNTIRLNGNSAPSRILDSTSAHLSGPITDQRHHGAKGTFLWIALLIAGVFQAGPKLTRSKSDVKGARSNKSKSKSGW